MGRDEKVEEAIIIARRLWPRGRALPRICVRPVKRGRFYPRTYSITLPEWLWSESRTGYLVYYVAHELAHAYSLDRTHGLQFQRALYRLCPEEYYHYEREYKPRRYAEFMRELARRR